MIRSKAVGLWGEERGLPVPRTGDPDAMYALGLVTLAPRRGGWALGLGTSSNAIDSDRVPFLRLLGWVS